MKLIPSPVVWPPTASEAVHRVLPLILSIAASLVSHASAAADPVPVVTGTRPAAIVIEDVPTNATQREIKGIQKAAQLLQFAVQRSTGVELEIRSGSLPEDPQQPVILIGGGPLTAEAGFPVNDLEPEQFRVATRGSVAALYGSGVEEYTRGGRFLPYCATSYWAVAEVITRQWGGLWIWPGPTGFSIPTRDALAITGIDATMQPLLMSRGFGLTSLGTKPKTVDPAVWDQVVEETGDWLRFHGMGSRGGYRSPHSFADWMEKYGSTQPDLFAQPPPGASLPENKPDRAKLRTSNPAVVETIVAEWEAAGRPPEWGFGPNDGAFFCTAPETLALDNPPNQDPNTVWNGGGNLSTRYARFYQDVSRAMKAKDADVTLLGLAYSCYREAPENPESFAVETPVILGFIHGLDDHAKNQWLGWQKTGAELFLRPNWLHSGASAPNLIAPQMVDWIKWSSEHGSRAFHFDSLLGYWGTQGLSYYAVARAGQDPNLPFNQILDEYCSAFGSAAEPVKRYLEYWMEYSKETAYPVAAGGAYVTNPEGLYAKAISQHGIPENPVPGSHWASLFLYPDSVIQPAQALLDEAAAAADTDETRARVAFLQAGLDQLVLTRDTGAAAIAASESPDAQKHFQSLAADLRKLRADLTPRHVVWADPLNQAETRSRSPVTAPSKTYDAREDQGM